MSIDQYLSKDLFGREEGCYSQTVYPFNKRLKKVISQAFVNSHICTEIFVKKVAEAAKTEIKKMAEKYNNNVIFTLGKDGAVAYENGTIEFIPAMKVDAIETTGAGDSYIGAVSHSIIEGKSLIEACKFATKCSAITVCRMGAQPSMPTLEDVE